MNLSLAVVLGIAQGIERKGIEVYQQMKGHFNDPLLDYLIEQEGHHIRVFQELFKTGLATSREQTMETPHLDEDYLMAAYANTEIFGQVRPTRVSAKGLFPLAVSLEKESIRFYLELVDEMPERFEHERELLRKIAGEERQHLRTLLAKKEAFTVHA